jgi:hypothetical protein
MAHTFQPTVIMCECPCHDRVHPMDTHHIVACCCPHRFLVSMDCPSCNVYHPNAKPGDQPRQEP